MSDDPLGRAADRSSGQPRLFRGIRGVIGDNYRLADVAGLLGRALSSLKALARRGQFPRLFRVSRNDLRVEKQALEAWAAERWGAEASGRARREAVRDAIRQPPRLRRQR